MKPIPGYKGLYSVTKTGRVFRHAKIVGARAGKTRRLKAAWLRGRPSKAHGYIKADLTGRDGTVKRFIVARLVLMAFDRMPIKDEEPNHKNLIKTDDRLTNLEWLTHLDNMAHARANGRHFSPFPALKGEQHYKSKLTEVNVRFIRKKYKYRGLWNIQGLAAHFSVSSSTIYAALRKKSWRHI